LTETSPAGLALAVKVMTCPTVGAAGADEKSVGMS